MEPSESAPQPSSAAQSVQYEQIHNIVAAEFTVEEDSIEYGTPTFYVTLKPNGKQAFLRLLNKLNPLQLMPILRKMDHRTVLQVLPKPKVRPSKPVINIALLLATIGTTMISGYALSLSWAGAIPNPIIGAGMFTIALMAILGAHETAHKLAANKHRIDATYPYFIPGPPAPIGIGTFGAVIQQKSLAPNRDALFDLGFSGPFVGFLVAIVVSIIGVSLSNVTVVQSLPEGTIQAPLLLELLSRYLIRSPALSAGNMTLIELHPVAFAGYIGMIVTMLNLMPVGQLDGGHVVRVLFGDNTRSVLSIIAVVSLLFVAWPMAIIAYLLSRVRDPGALDDVSNLSRSRKLAALALVAVFVLSVAPIAPLINFWG